MGFHCVVGEKFCRNSILVGEGEEQTVGDEQGGTFNCRGSQKRILLLFPLLLSDPSLLSAN